jgi:hypothetical protein
MIADVERARSGEDVYCVIGLWPGSKLASSSRLVVPVFAMAR